MKYFKFIDKFNVKIEQPTKESFVEKILWRILPSIIPRANPDFDRLYDKVITWYIEYDDINNITNREIGVDKNGIVIVKGPFGKNLGFWTDEDLTIEQYDTNFKIEYIKQDEFEKLWLTEGQTPCEQDSKG